MIKENKNKSTSANIVLAKCGVSNKLNYSTFLAANIFQFHIFD